MDGFWRHSLCVGVTSKLIAKKRGIDTKRLEEYFIAGILHDLGKIPLNNKLSEAYIQTMSISDKERMPLYKAEKQNLLIDHAEVGLLIVDNWKLGQEIRDAVGNHHSYNSYTGNNKDIVYTITLANHFANSFEIGYSGDRYPEAPADEVFSFLQVNFEYLEEIEDTVNGEIEKARVFLRLAV